MAAPDTSLRKLAPRPPGRPADVVYGVDEVASLLELPERFVLARLKMGSFFPGAFERDGVWRIPERAVRHCLGCRVRPLFSIEAAAAMLGLSYDHTFKQTALVASLDTPLPEGKSIRALPLFFAAGGKPMKRIHEDELLRVQGVMTARGKEAR